MTKIMTKIFKHFFLCVLFVVFSLSLIHAEIVGIFGQGDENQWGYTQCKQFYIQHKQKEFFVPRNIFLTDKKDIYKHRYDFISEKVDRDMKKFNAVFAAVFNAKQQIQSVAVIRPSRHNIKRESNFFYIHPISFAERIKSDGRRVKMMRSMMERYVRSNDIKQYRFYVQFYDARLPEKALSLQNEKKNASIGGVFSEPTHYNIQNMRNTFFKRRKTKNKNTLPPEYRYPTLMYQKGITQAIAEDNVDNMNEK
ncbi:MAG: hypothetical protein K2X98_01065 [Alphaproteobacteria bacterium]|nr:hypothetical protein [Alphaproteobacteria bacterium]